MNILADATVWVGHFRQRNEDLVALLEDGRVVGHPHVVAELACAMPPGRQSIVGMLAQLESAPVATHDELLLLIGRRALCQRGCGFVDMSLIASALLGERIRLWSLDDRLNAVAAELGRCYRPSTRH